MVSPESGPTIFVDAQAGEATLVPLTDIGETVTSVTATTRIARDPSMVAYYVKQQGEGSLEVSQLSALRARGIPIPSQVLTSFFGGELATSFAGRPLSDVLAQSSESAGQALLAAGQTLQRVHEVLNSGPIPDNILSRTFANTSHIVDCFFYKWQGVGSGVTPDLYRAHKTRMAAGGYAEKKPGEQAVLAPYAEFIPMSDTFHPALKSLVAVINVTAAGYAEDLAPSRMRHAPEDGYPDGEYLHIPDQTIAYGDFKPENILVNNEGGDTAVTMIDPLLSWGSTYFDLAKFASRASIDSLATGKLNLEPFFDGYGLRPIEDMRVYGPFTFSDLMGIDILNICKSYIKRYEAGDRTYRLAGALDSPEFCDGLAALLSGVSGVDSTRQLDRLLFA